MNESTQANEQLSVLQEISDNQKKQLEMQTESIKLQREPGEKICGSSNKNCEK